MPARPSPVAVLRSAVVTVIALVWFGPAALAHHSIAGQFDMTKTVRLNGVVSKLEWTNPHAYLFLDTKDAQGASVVWKLETLPVAMLRKAGIKKQMLVTGEPVEMHICPARNGAQQLGFVLSIKFPDGRRFQFSKDPNGGATAIP